MGLKATQLTATITGMWTVLGMGTVGVLMKGRDLDVLTHNIIVLSAAAVFLFVPGLLFVIGRHNIRFGFRYVFSREYWEEYRQELPRILFRMLCWFLGGGAFGIVYSLLLESLGLRAI